MGDEIKIVGGRKYQKRGGQWFDIGPADNSSVKVLNGRKYENRGGQWFDIGAEDVVKKKEQTTSDGGSDSDLSSAGASLSGSQLSSALATGAEVGKVSNDEPEKKRVDIFEGLKDQSKKLYTPKDKPLPNLGWDDDKVDISFSVDGERLKISPNALPDGYEKTREGALQYVQDMSTGMLKASLGNDANGVRDFHKSIKKTAIVSRLDDIGASVTNSDKEKAKLLLGGMYSEDASIVISALKNEKAKIYEEMAQSPAGSFDRAKRLGDIKDLITKYGRSKQDEAKSDGGNLYVKSAEESSDLQSFLKKAPGIISPVAQYPERVGVEKLSDALVTGLESLKNTEPGRYSQLKRRISEGKTIGSTVAAELTSIGADIIEARQIEKLSSGEIDIDQYFEKSDSLNEVRINNLYSRPDILQKYVSGVIAKHYYGDWNNPLVGKWFVSDEEIDDIPLSEFQKAGIDVTRPEFASVIKNIKKNEGILPFDNAIQKDGLLREMKKGFMQPITGTIDAVTGVFTSADQKRVESEVAPVEDYVNERSKQFAKQYGGIADAFNGAGQFVSQYLMMEAGIGAFKNIGALAGGSSKMRPLLFPESGAVQMVRSGGNKVGNYIIDNSNRISQISTPFISTFDSYYKEALSKSDNINAARAYAFANAGMEALSEQMFDNVKFGREVVNNFRKSSFSIDDVARIFDKGITEESKKQYQNILKDKITRSINAVVKSGGGLAQEAAEEIPVAASNFISDALLSPQSIEDRDILDEMKDSFLSGLVSFSIPSILGAAGRVRKQFSVESSEKDALMIAAMNRGDVVSSIYAQQENGVFDQEEVNSKVKTLNTAASSLKEIPANYITGKRLSEGDRVEYLSLLVKEKALLEQNKDLKEGDPILGINKQKINEINTQKAEILIKTIPNEPVVENTVKTPEEDEEEIVKSVDPAKVDAAQKLIKEFDDNDAFGINMPAEEKDFAAKYPMSFLKAIADQVSGSKLGGVEMNTEKQMVDRYGQAVVDLAVETFGVVSNNEDTENPAPSMKLRQKFIDDQEEKGIKYKTREEFETAFRDAHKGVLIDDELDFNEVINGRKKAALADSQDFKPNSLDVNMAKEKGLEIKLIDDPASGTTKWVIGEKSDIDILVSELSKPKEVLMENGGEAYHRAMGKFLGYKKGEIEAHVLKNKEIAELSDNVKKNEDAAIAEVEVNKNTELKSLYKPDVSLKLDIPAERLVQSKDRMKNIEEYDAVKKDFQSLQDVISCIYG